MYQSRGTPSFVPTLSVLESGTGADELGLRKSRLETLPRETDLEWPAAAPRGDRKPVKAERKREGAERIEESCCCLRLKESGAPKPAAPP